MGRRISRAGCSCRGHHGLLPSALHTQRPAHRVAMSTCLPSSHLPANLLLPSHRTTSCMVGTTVQKCKSWLVCVYCNHPHGKREECTKVVKTHTYIHRGMSNVMSFQQINDEAPCSNWLPQGLQMSKSASPRTRGTGSSFQVPSYREPDCHLISPSRRSTPSTHSEPSSDRPLPHTRISSIDIVSYDFPSCFPAASDPPSVAWSIVDQH